MNPKAMRKLTYFLITTLFAVSCKNYVYLTVVEPPPVYISDNIHAVGVMNRSLATGKNKILDVIDEGLSGEGPELDLIGSNASVQGCNDELLHNSNLERVIILDTQSVKSPGQGLMPAALSWDEVEKICLDNDLQALFVLEAYDTDTKINYSEKTVYIKNPFGVNIPAIEHHVQMITTIKEGWRIYDPGTKTILDQFFIGDNLVNNSQGINPVKAAAGLIGRKEAVKQISNQVGHSYATRILQVPIRVRRQYFIGGSSNLRMARRRAQVNNWDGAADLWLTDTKSPKRKVAGRAAYNMAIICEIRGDLQGAIVWSQKSYSDYRIKLGRSYARILTARKSRIDQMRMMHENDQ